MSDEAYRRYVNINLPHARTVASRVGRCLEALGAFGEAGNGGAFDLLGAFDKLEADLQAYEEDPPFETALAAADAAAALARALVDAILATTLRSDRLGQLQCGERPDSPRISRCSVPLPCERATRARRRR